MKNSSEADLSDSMDKEAGTASYLGCSVKELQKLMELRKTEALAELQNKYDGLNGLCKRLKTHPTEGI